MAVQVGDTVALPHFCPEEIRDGNFPSLHTQAVPDNICPLVVMVDSVAIQEMDVLDVVVEFVGWVEDGVVEVVGWVEDGVVEVVGSVEDAVVVTTG